MDHVEDVQRLFSWLKAPTLHYREFAPQREIADAVRTWPVAHRAAVRTGVASLDEPGPERDVAAKERIARDSRTLPAAVPVQSVAESGAAMPEATLDAEIRAARPDEAGAASETETVGAPVQPAVEPMIAGFDEPPAAAAEAAEAAQQRSARVREPAAHYPGPERGALFAGEYRGSDRDPRLRERVADRHDRSLDAVFSRLSGSRDRLPDPRARARTSPGLGAVFGRLR